MRRLGFFGWVALSAASISALVACQLAAEKPEPVALQRQTAEQGQAAVQTAPLPERFEVTLPWGSAVGSVGLERAVPESVAYGPNAVAIADNGESLVLDRLNERIVRVAADGSVQTLASVPRHAEDLVAGAGSVVAFSPLASRAWFFDSTGHPAGELAVPRELRELVGLSVGASRRLSVHTGFQERLELGSPSAPLALEVTLHGKREGARILPDGSGVAIRASGGRAELLRLSQAEGDVRSRVLSSTPLSGTITAARVIGAVGFSVCLRTEHVRSLPELSVERRAVCVDASSDKVVFDEALPAPGLFHPRTELAFENGRLSQIHATDAGLRVTNVKLSSSEVAQ